MSNKNNKPTKLAGRVWVITDAKGELIDDIDTDMIFHNAHLAITDKKLMGPHAFGNLPGWQDFPKKAQPGDILVVGRNFGAGSSRQQAVDCFPVLGVTAIVARSFGAIYKRNAINSGLPIISCDQALEKLFGSGDQIEVDLTANKIVNKTRDKTVATEPFSVVQLDIYQAGDLFAYGKANAGA